MDSTLATLSVALSGRYDIDREIGRGGMASVYLARDIKHERNVALKVLSPELGAVLGADRFLTEIRVTAQLQHPNVLPLFDSGQADGLLFYSMPYVEGETLRHRLDREKQFAIDEAVRIAIAIANALDYAHRHGVIHRDLKPENILLHEGQPLVADFGIALAVSNAGGTRVTQTGLSLGTPQYMSPEQATGDRVIDGRTDIYSLGAITYEMIAGEPPHVGAGAQAIIARLMTEEPRPLSAVRRSVPPHVDDAVSRALEKLAADRFATAGQFAAALGDPSALHTVGTSSRARRRTATRSRAMTWVPVLVGVAGVSAAIIAYASRPAVAPALVTRFDMPAGDEILNTATGGWVGVDPDGSRVFFISGVTGATHLYARTLADPTVRAIPGTDGLLQGAFSLDGTSIVGRTSASEIVRLPLDGGSPVVLASTSAVAVVAGNKGDVVMTRPGSPLLRVPPGGGAPVPLTKLDVQSGESGHLTPSFLPRGDALLFSVVVAPKGTRRLAAVTIDGRVKRFDVPGSNPIYIEPGYVLFASGPSSLAIAPFDQRKLEFTGPALPAVTGIQMRPSGAVAVGVSRDGRVLAYLSGVATMRLVLVGEGGETTVLDAPPQRYRHPRISPDGRRALVEIAAADGTNDVWMYDLTAKTFSRLTFDGVSSDPVWMPGGNAIAFSKRFATGQATDAYTMPANGSQAPQLLVGGAGSQYPTTFTPDGKTVVYDELMDTLPMHIMALTTGGQPRLLVNSPRGVARLPAVSPDGKWLAYTSTETNRTEVYVRSMLPGAEGGRWQVSLEGGSQPAWSPDSRTLFYRDEHNIVAATVSTTNGFAIAARRAFSPERFTLDNTINYSVMPDGKRLLMTQPADSGSRLVIVVNWMDEVRAKLKAGK